MPFLVSVFGEHSLSSMQYFIIVLLFCFFLFLFTLYVLSHDDFLFLRKNVTLEQLFNIAFLTAGIGLLSSRIAFVALNFDPAFVNPLAFLLFPYFPGLSLLGAVIGGSIFLLLYLRFQKLPVLRILDYFSFSLLAVIPFGLLGAFVLSKKPIASFEFIGIWVYITIFIFFCLSFLPSQKKAELKEGTITLLFLVSFSIVGFLADIVTQKQRLFHFLSLEGILYIVLFLVSLFFISRNEGLFIALPKHRK